MKANPRKDIVIIDDPKIEMDEATKIKLLSFLGKVETIKKSTTTKISFINFQLKSCN